MEGRHSAVHGARLFFVFCFHSQPSNNSSSWNGSVKAKPNRRVPSCELTCHFRVGRPFQRSFHSCAQFIYSNSLHTSKPDNTHTHTAHNAMSAGQMRGREREATSGVFSTRLAHPEHVSHVIRLSHCQVLRSSIRPLCSADWIVRFAGAAAVVVWHQVRSQRHWHTHTSTHTLSPTP